MIGSQIYPVGVDCVWIGLDANDYVAAFVTAGVGDIPRAVLVNTIVDIVDMENGLQLLPEVAGAEILVSVPHPDDFMNIAKRGLYVYDWGRAGMSWWQFQRVRYGRMG